MSAAMHYPSIRASSAGEAGRGRRVLEDRVERIYGVVGHSLNPVVDTVRRADGTGWVHVRNEEAGAFAAAETQLTGPLADAHQRVCGMFLGGSDLAADLSAEGAWENLLYTHTPVLNGHVVKPAMLREADLVAAMAARNGME